MKILFIAPSNNMAEIMGGARVFVHATEPLGILYIAAVLEAVGHEVEVLDAWVEGKSLEDVQDYLSNEGPWDVIGISCLTSSGAFTFELGRHIKKEYPKTRVVLGNVHATVYHRFFLEQGCADFVVLGEGELVTRDLLATLEKGLDPVNVKGIAFLRDGNVVNTGPGPVVEDLDRLPLPARHLVPMAKYSGKDFVANYSKGSFRVMHTSRGCPFDCTFCVVNAQRRYRMRSPERVVDEIELLIRGYGASFIEFLDPLFTVNRPRVIAIMKSIVERGLEFQFEAEGHVNTVNRETLEWMKRGGCRNMAYGIETASPELIRKIRKGSSLERVEAAVGWTAEAGIEPHGLFILGFPGETPAMSEETIRFALSLPLAFAQFAVLVPYPGSEIYNDLVAAGDLDREESAEEKVASWERFNAYLSFSDVDPIYVPPGRTAEELKGLQRSAIRRFYLRPRQIARELGKFRFRNWREYVEGVKTVFLSA